MTDTTNDINALLRNLGYAASIGHLPWRHAALTALIAERDAIRQENDSLRSWCKAHQDEVLDLVFEMDALRKRIAELEAHPPADRDRELRERLVCAALTGLCADGSFDLDESASSAAVAIADRTLAAMRKGDSRE